jgi:hypothetical protein
MRTKILYAALGAALVLTGSAKADDQNLQEFSKGDFSILMPGTPSEQTKSIPSPAGNMDMKLYIASAGDTGFVYLVATLELPKGGLGGATEEFLDGAQTGLVQGAKGKLVSQSKIKHGKHSGRDITAEVFDGKGLLRGHVFLVDQKMYMLVIMTPKDADASGAIDKFLGSFKVNE